MARLQAEVLPFGSCQVLFLDGMVLDLQETFQRIGRTQFTRLMVEAIASGPALKVDGVCSNNLSLYIEAGWRWSGQSMGRRFWHELNTFHGG